MGAWGLGVKRGPALGSQRPLWLGLLLATESLLGSLLQAPSVLPSPPSLGPLPFILLPQSQPPPSISSPWTVRRWLCKSHQPAQGSGLGTGFQKPPGTLCRAHSSSTFSSPRGPLPPGTGTCFSCSWSGRTSAQVMPRRARSTGRRPGRWPPSPGEGCSLNMGLLGALGSAWLRCPARFPDWMELFTVSKSQAGLADKRGRLVSNR